MTAPEPQPRKKKAYRLFLPFIIIGVLILISKVPFGRLFDGSFKSSFSSHSAKFNHEEILEIIDNYSIDYAAGQCVSKGFIELKSFEATNMGQNCTAYSYFFIPNASANIDRDYDKCYENMQEAILLWSNEDAIDYVFKKEENYKKFKNYLLNDLHAQPYEGRSLSHFQNSKMYKVQNMVFVDRNYYINFHGFCLHFIPLKVLEGISTKYIEDSLAEEKRYNDSVALVVSHYNDLLGGLWKGSYNGYSITFAILKISNDTVYGYSSLEGNFASFIGTLTPGNSGFNLELKEKEAKNNGIFQLSFDSTENTITGSWKSFHGTAGGDLNFTRALQGDKLRVIADKAFLFSEHEYKTQTRSYFTKGDELQYDSLSTVYIHCTYNSSGYQTSGWVLIKKIAFQ